MACHDCYVCPVRRPLIRLAEHVKGSAVGFSAEEVDTLFETMDVDRSGTIDYIEWLDFVEPLRVRGMGRVRCLCGW